MPLELYFFSFSVQFNLLVTISPMSLILFTSSIFVFLTLAIVLFLMPSVLVVDFFTTIEFLMRQFHILFASVFIVTGLFDTILYSSA